MRETEISYSIEMMDDNGEWVELENCVGERTIEDVRYVFDSLKLEMPNKKFRIMECTSVTETRKRKVQ